MTIKEICETYDLSQTALARKFGIPLRTVQDWHAGRRKAPDYVISMMTRLLELEK
jgi:putative transcriptional regulator